MARRIRAREVLRLRSVNGLSQNAIARNAHVSAQDEAVCAGVAFSERVQMAGGERRLVRKYGAFGLLVIDEWLLDRPDAEYGSMLLELMELRCGTASTVLCTQFKKKGWRPRLGGGVHADAIMGRIVHNAAWVDMGEANMRQRHG